MATFLLIDDDTLVQKVVRSCLVQHDVVCVATLEAARDLLKEPKWDMILLDVELPDGDGLSFLVEIQALVSEREVPVVLLTGRTRAVDKVAGYTMGAEDYITKPLDPLVFKARIESKIRKRQAQQKQIKKDGFTFSLEKQTVVYDSVSGSMPIDLTTLEFKLLLYMVLRKDHILSREKLIFEVWGDNLNITDRTIDSHISHLRKRLLGSTLTIQSVYGAGYKLTDAQAKSAA